MNRTKMIEEIKQNFMLKRINAQDECKEFLNKLREDKDFDALYTELTKKELDYLKSKYVEENLSLKHDVEDLKTQIDSYLKQNNIDQTKLSPKYDCPLCNDTGVVGGKMCNCLLRALNNKISRMTSSQEIFKTFKQCEEAIMNEDDKKVKDILQNWCEKFPEVKKFNVNLIGSAGSGKTFMLECVANELMQKGFNVCFKTAFELNELARLYHIGKAFDLTDCINADILFIDDLGTEPNLRNITNEYLYNLINTRQINHRPTFISTNLSLDNILSKYDERIFSRLTNKALALNLVLTSSDKRLK